MKQLAGTKVLPFIATATAMSALGLLTVPAPAQATPMVPQAPAACDSWHLNSNTLTIDLSGIGQLFIDWNGTTGPSVADPNTKLTGSVSNSGFARGHGGPDPTVDLTITWSRSSTGTPSHLTGKIDPQFGSANGTYDSGQWNAHEHFTCVHYASQEPPAPPPPAPAPAPAPPAALTATVNADTDLYDKPSDQGGHKIGMLTQGQVVKVASTCTANAWCTLTSPAGAAWGRDLTNN
jgi:hypothetical protein